MTAPLPYDPDSEVGKRVAAGLEAVLADAINRLRKEGKPVPDLAADDDALASTA